MTAAPDFRQIVAALARADDATLARVAAALAAPAPECPAGAAPQARVPVPPPQSAMPELITVKVATGISAEIRGRDRALSEKRIYGLMSEVDLGRQKIGGAVFLSRSKFLDHLLGEKNGNAREKNGNSGPDSSALRSAD